MNDPDSDATTYGRALRTVFYASPLFWLVDAGLGWNFRVSGLSDPDHRGVYYLALTAVGALLWFRPAWTRLAALAEPAVNFALLIIASWQTVFQAPAAVYAGEAPELMTLARLLNLLLSGGMLHLAIQSSIRGLRSTGPSVD